MLSALADHSYHNPIPSQCIPSLNLQTSSNSSVNLNPSPTSSILGTPPLPRPYLKRSHQASGAWCDSLGWHTSQAIGLSLVFLMYHVLAHLPHLIPFQITIYDQENFQGKRMEFTSSCPNVSERSFDNVRSLKVECGAWVWTSAELKPLCFRSLQT